MDERQIVSLIKEHHHEYPLEDIRYSLVELGYTYDEAEGLIDEALYSNRNKAARNHQKMALAGGASIVAGIAITIAAFFGDQKTWVRLGEGTRAGEPATVQEALAAYDAGDYEKALNLLKPFADQGDPKAQALLGSMYDNGDGISNNHAEAARWYEKAAAQGNIQAQSLLGEMYLLGRGVKRDEREAAKWYRKAAEQGSVEAQRQVAEMYAKGTGFEQDHSQAAVWHRRAAERGSTASQTALSVYYAEGRGGLRQNFKKAASWARKAAEQGDARAQTILGVLYSTGQGVPKDLSEAYRWLQLAHAGGSPGALAEIKRLEAEMTPDQIQKARENSSQFSY